MAPASPEGTAGVGGGFGADTLWVVSRRPRVVSRHLLDVRGLQVLELGAGCGLCGLAAAAAGARAVVLTEGAPGALAALERSATDNSFDRHLRVEDVSGDDESDSEGCDVRVAFLDWRDDQAALDSGGGGGSNSSQATLNPKP